MASCLRDQTETFFGRTGSSLSMGERDFSYKKVTKKINYLYYSIYTELYSAICRPSNRTVGDRSHCGRPGLRFEPWMGDLESGTMNTIDHHTFFLPYRPLWLEQPGLVSWRPKRRRPLPEPGNGALLLRNGRARPETRNSWGRRAARTPAVLQLARNGALLFVISWFCKILLSSAVH